METQQLAQIGLGFLARVELKGTEVDHFVVYRKWLTDMLQPTAVPVPEQLDEATDEAEGQ